MLLPLPHHWQESIYQLVRSVGQNQFSYPLVGIIALADEIALLAQPVDNTTDLPFVEFSNFDNFFLCCRHVFKKNQQHAPMRQRHASVTAQQIGGLRVQVGLNPGQPEGQKSR